ncbi:MAG: hypothetical protein HKN62_11925, partial [Phycisphaerales bacterium]|nr:hypothetical protein [Phycisphaerales bacterium]
MRRERSWPAWAFALSALITLTTISVPAYAAPPSGGAGAATTASVSRLLEEMGALMDEVTILREQLATARLVAADATRELEELRQFIQDHEQLGNDFAQYRLVKAAAEEEAKIRVAEARRQQREAARQERLARYRAARADRDRANAESDRLDRYRRAGFGSIGMDVFTGRMAYAYQTVERDP